MKHINVQLNPNLEYMNSILLTSKYNEITKKHIGYGLMTEEVNEYTSRIKCFFEKYLNDPIYPYIESLIPNGFTFSRPVELMLSLGSSMNFTIQHPLSDLCVEYCGGLTTIQNLLHLLKKFETKIDYFAFFEGTKNYYNPIIDRANSVANKYPYISILENEYGKEHNSYNYVISSLMIGNYGISFVDEKSEKVDLFSVFTTDNFSISPPILLHEFSHPFINPLTEKYADIVKKYENTYELLKPYKLHGFLSGYGDWTECVNEHFVRAMVIHLLRKHDLLDMAETMLNRDLYLGYKYIPFILEQYQYYDNNRDNYPDFESFYPVLLKVFSRNIEKQS